jgi:hypothetical protein
MQPNRQQLVTVKRLLREAHRLVSDAQAVFHGAGDAVEAVAEANRLKAVCDAIRDRIEHVDQLLAAANQP